MNFSEFKDAVYDAEVTTRRADHISNQIAQILVGRLRSVTKGNMYSDHNILCALKKELSQYNARTREWKS